MENKDILFSEYWAELSKKIEKSTRPSLKDEFFALFWKEPSFALAAASFILGIVSIRVLTILKINYEILEYLPSIVCLFLYER